MAGHVPWLSGLALVPPERQLKRVEIGCRFGFEQAIKAPAMHQVRADQAGEGERAGDRRLGCLGQAEQQKGDLDAHGIFAGAEEATDFEGLLDPAEEQLDRPAALLERPRDADQALSHGSRSAVRGA